MANYKNPNAEINFITDNPGTEAFVAGQKAAREAETAELANQGRIVENAVNLESAPSRLRKINADASTATSAADVAYRTRDSQVTKSGADASHAVADADVAVGTVGSRIGASNQNLRTATANADVAVGTVAPKIAEAQSGATIKGNEATVSAATVPDKIQSSKIGLRQQQATALNTEMQGFYKSLELANAGDIEGAKATAAATGQTIPDQVFQNAELRAAITRAAQRAKEIYPDRPKDQQTFIHGFITDIANRKGQGQSANDPAAPYAVPGAPEPQESTGSDKFSIFHRQEPDPNDPTKTITRSYNHSQTTGELTAIDGQGAFDKPGSGPGGRAGGKTSVFQQKQAAWLEVHPGDAQGALAYASGHRQMTEYDIQKSSLAMAGREIAGNMQTKFATPAAQNAAITARAAEMATVLRSAAATSVGGTRPAPVAPGTPAPAPAAVGGAPPGAGTKDAPYQASTQAHVDWFKKNAPAGAVIIINGKPFTK